MRPFRVLASAYDYRPGLGGIATCAHELLSALSRIEGVEVRLVSVARDGDEIHDAGAPFDVRRVPLPGSAARAVAPLSLRLAREAAEFRPDAQVSFLWMPDGAAAWLGFRGNPGLARRVPRFVFAHGVEVIESRRTLRKRVRAALSPVKKRVFADASAVFAVSRFTGELVRTNCGVAPGRIEVVHCGVDSGSFFPGPPAQDLVGRYGLDGKKVFLTVSRLQDYKGLDRAISALRWVVQRHPEAVYLICGEGEDRPRLERLVRHYRVRPHVVFAGAVADERLRDHYNLADAFVLLSREDWEAPNVEGFGIVFLEAAACGKPAIGGRSGGISDAVEDGRTGWLVDPWDDRAIAAAMSEAIERPEIARLRGETALARARGGFAWAGIAEKVLDRMREEARSHVRD